MCFCGKLQTRGKNPVARDCRIPSIASHVDEGAGGEREGGKDREEMVGEREGRQEGTG